VNTRCSAERVNDTTTGLPRGQHGSVVDQAVELAVTRARRTLRTAGRLQPFHRGRILIATGADSDEVLLIESGVVKVLLPATSGLDVVIGLHGRGALLGELGVLASRPRSATVLGHQDGIATHVASERFRELVHRDRDVRELADVTQRQRLHSADSRQLAVATMNVRARTVARLLDWAETFGEPVDGGLVLRGLSHRDLAGAVLASEKHVDAVLKALRSAGLVRTERMCFVLTDPTGMRQLLRRAES
jgi:CRP/FNR family cyclic AMP-dependent transcriptional regulator